MIAQFVNNWRWTDPGDTVVIGVSGGTDSLALLHMVHNHIDCNVVAVHVRHNMRRCDINDLRKVVDTCNAWKVDFVLRSLSEVPKNEGEARSMRYKYLLNIKKCHNAKWLLTGHHQDDQVETVLFRIIRGTGINGLSGIPETRDPGILRPLLPFSREQLTQYCLDNGIEPIEDPTNKDVSYSRNRIRHNIVPELEKTHPGAKESILRLSRNADRTQRITNTLLTYFLNISGVVEYESANLIRLRRTTLRGVTRDLQVECMHHFLRNLKCPSTEATVENAVDFINSDTVEGSIDLPDGFALVVSTEVLNVSYCTIRRKDATPD